MVFALQTVNHSIDDEDVFIVKKIIDRSSYSNSYVYMDLKEISVSPLVNSPKEIIPIGDLKFVGSWLNCKFGTKNLSPIEVPKPLRNFKFLQREYFFTNKENIQLTGRKFIKNISKLKSFSYMGDLKNIDPSSMPTGMYVVSEIIPIVSEYRVFVSDLTIKAIQYYDGDCTYFPDINVISEMILFYYLNKNRPVSYTLDVALTQDLKTIVLEVHPITSVGLYGYTGEDLLYMYFEGVQWYKSHEGFLTYKE